MTDLTRDEQLAVERLQGARLRREPCAPVRDLIGETDQASAYRVQQALIAERLATGRRVVGHKIGLTTRVVQTQLGVGSPDFGVLLDDMMLSDREPMGLDRFLEPRVEAEIAFVLGSDLDSPTANVADVIRATDFVLPSIEVVDSRVADWDIRITDTVADNASSGAVVLGTTPQSLMGLDLPTLGMTLEHAGQLISSGAGAACLGSPVIAVAWLARALARLGTPLVAGEVILSGALGPVVAVNSPGTYRAEIEGLGAVSAVFIEAGPGGEGQR